MPARPVSTSVTTSHRERPVVSAPGLGDRDHVARPQASNGDRVGGQAGQLELDRRGDLERRDLRQRPQVGPVGDRHRDPDPVAGRKPPAGRHQRQLERGLAGDLDVHRGGRDRLRRAVGGDVVELDRHQRARPGMPQPQSARPARRRAATGAASGSLSKTALRASSRRLVEELAGGRRRRAPLPGHDPRRHPGGRRRRPAQREARAPHALAASAPTRATRPDTTACGRTGVSGLPMKKTDRGRAGAGAGAASPR